jgi:hypothetical protein
VVPYTPAPINLTSGITSLFGGSRVASTKEPAEQQFEEHRIQLEQRVAVVEQGLSGIGVRSVQLQTDDLVELFYHIYNPTDGTGSAPSREM